MYFDTGEISWIEFKYRITYLTWQYFLLSGLIMTPIVIYGKKGIHFSWKKNMMFAGWSQEKISEKESGTMINAYEYCDYKYKLHKFPSDGLKHDFEYGEEIYRYGEDEKTKYYFASAREYNNKEEVK